MFIILLMNWNNVSFFPIVLQKYLQQASCEFWKINVSGWAIEPAQILIILTEIEFAKLRTSRAFAPYVPSYLRAIALSRITRLACLTHTSYLRALRALFVRVKIVLGRICSPAKTFHFPWIIEGITNCVVLNKSFNLK